MNCVSVTCLTDYTATSDAVWASPLHMWFQRRRMQSSSGCVRNAGNEIMECSQSLLCDRHSKVNFKFQATIVAFIGSSRGWTRLAYLQSFAFAIILVSLFWVHTMNSRHSLICVTYMNRNFVVLRLITPSYKRSKIWELFVGYTGYFPATGSGLGCKNRKYLHPPVLVAKMKTMLRCWKE